MKKKLLYIFLFTTVVAFAGNPPAEKARGIFIAFGVGPRLPVSFFASSSDLGYGFNIEVSYTDTDYLPFFLFTRIGYEQYPGSQDFYRKSTYSNFSTTAIPITAGARFYFPPLVENIALLIPLAEVAVSFSFYQKLHQFKPEANRNNFTEDNSKLGLTAGVGISMFMLEILLYYNYYETNQYVAADMKVRLPLFIIY